MEEVPKPPGVSPKPKLVEVLTQDVKQIEMELGPDGAWRPKKQAAISGEQPTGGEEAKEAK